MSQKHKRSNKKSNFSSFYIFFFFAPMFPWSQIGLKIPTMTAYTTENNNIVCPRRHWWPYEESNGPLGLIAVKTGGTNRDEVALAKTKTLLVYKFKNI